MVTGRDGYGCALAGYAANNAATLAAMKSHRRDGFIVSSGRE
jgi:hypothetical protein